MTNVEANPVLLEMARNHFGYGRWDAPYWFIGPEQGQKREENHDLTLRLLAWQKLKCPELCDCAQFHREINQDDWHDKRKLQPTWRKLIRLLKSFQGKSTDLDELRAYQSGSLGSVNGETCVIELAGLAANNYLVPRDRRAFRSERINTIKSYIGIHQPKFVVMYGRRDSDAWDEIAEREIPQRQIVVCGATALVAVPHPISRGTTNQFWEALGAELRERVTHF